MRKTLSPFSGKLEVENSISRILPRYRLHETQERLQCPLRILDMYQAVPLPRKRIRKLHTQIVVLYLPHIKFTQFRANLQHLQKNILHYL